ncbi:MAG: hypothetical protein R2765_10130 [Ferruginibacter sp.]
MEAIKITERRISEDTSKDAENAAQQETDKYIALIEKYLTAKEKEIMAV